MDLENLTREELLEKLDALKKEHASLDELVTELSERLYLTPEESLEFNRLRKIKLKKKDLIATLTRQIAKQE